MARLHWARLVDCAAQALGSVTGSGAGGAWRERSGRRVPAERLVYAVLQLAAAARQLGFTAASVDVRALEPAEPRAATG